MKEISIIIVSWNTRQLTLSAIDSLIKSKINVSHEIIVVDNASEDGTLQGLKKLVFKNKSVRLIQLKKNYGFAKANNEGIKKSRGRYVMLLNSDTKVQVGTIDKLYQFAEKNKEIGVVVPKLLNRDGTGQGSVYKFPTLIRALMPKTLEKYIPRRSGVVDVAVMAAYLITPFAIKKVGKLDEKFFMYFEDFDYARRIKKSGLKIYYLASAKVVHYHGASGGTWEQLKESSKAYHGSHMYHAFTFLLWMGLKVQKHFYILLLLLLIIPAISSLIRPGFFPMQDDLQAFRTHQMGKCFSDLQFPCRWVPDAGYGYGYPQFNFYPPLPYYFGATLHLFGVQYIDAVKILFVLGYVFSALLMYVLVSEITSRWGGFVAGVLYTYIPYKAVEVYVRGALGEFWAQIFFLLIFWSSYKLIKTGNKFSLVVLSLSIGGLATSHLLMSMIFAPVFALWVVYWLYVSGFVTLRKLILGITLGALLSAFFILPVIFERKFVHVESLLSGYFDYRAHFVDLENLFLSFEWGYGSSGFPDEKLNLSLGVPQWILGLVFAPIMGVYFLTKPNKRKYSVLILMLFSAALFSAFMIHLRSSFIWERLSFLAWLQFPWRILGVSIFLLSLLSGIFIDLSGKYKSVFGVFVILLAIFLYSPFFVPKDWLNISDREKFSGESWDKQLTISIFDYLPIYATLPPWQAAPELPEIIEGEGITLEYEKFSDSQRGIVEVKERALVRLPIYDFPGMEVLVDGAVVSHINDDCRGQRYCLGLITFEIDDGLHEIEVELKDTPVRTIGNIISAVGIVGVGVVAFKRDV